MKSFLVKIGKTFQTLKRDGFLNGSKKILFFLKSYFKLRKKLPAGDVLFVTDGVGDSALYRSHNVSEELNLNGFKSFVTISESPHLLDYADSFKVFIFQKVSSSDRIGKFINKIKFQNKEIIFETDDLVFDPRYLANADYLKNINVLEKKQYEKGIGGEIVNDDYVKVCTTTTSFLADKLRECGKKVFVVPNKLSKSDVEIADNIIKHKAYSIEQKTKCSMLHAPCSIIKLGYFSGTISHNKDFATITDALMRIMKKYPQIKLFLVGPLDIENKLNKFKNRIVQLPYVSREKHFENISKVDINLAPLEIGNPFCESKSELKFFEAGIVGVPTVASATKTFKEAISDGTTGFVVSDTDEWFLRLERLILSSEERSRMGQEARKKALERYTTETAKNEEYYGYLREKIH